MSSDEVVHLHDPVLRHLEADGPVRALLKQFLHFVLRKAEGIAQAQARGMVVDECLLSGLHLRADFGKLLGRVERIVCKAFLHQLFSIFPIDSAPLALSVRCVRMLFGSDLHDLPVLVDSFVRNDSAPIQSLDDVGFGSGNEPLRIRILNSDDEISSVLLGVQIVIKRSPDSAHVKGACRRRRESYSCSSFHF